MKMMTKYSVGDIVRHHSEYDATYTILQIDGIIGFYLEENGGKQRIGWMSDQNMERYYSLVMDGLERILEKL